MQRGQPVLVHARHRRSGVDQGHDGVGAACVPENKIVGKFSFAKFFLMLNFSDIGTNILWRSL